MNQQEITKGNVAIAEFMGAKDNSSKFGMPIGTSYLLDNPVGVVLDYMDHDEPYLSNEERSWIVVDMCYHTSWDWLMPVVEKIESLSFGDYVSFTVVIKNKFCVIYCHYNNVQDGVIYQTPYLSNIENKAEAVYAAVLAFIEWYNNQPQTNEQ